MAEDKTQNKNKTKNPLNSFIWHNTDKVSLFLQNSNTDSTETNFQNPKFEYWSIWTF